MVEGNILYKTSLGDARAFVRDKCELPLAAEGDYMKNRTIKIFSAILLGVMLVVILALTASASGTKNLANDADFSGAIVGTTSHGESIDSAAKTGALISADTNDGNRFYVEIWNR